MQSPDAQQNMNTSDSVNNYSNEYQKLAGKHQKLSFERGGGSSTLFIDDNSQVHDSIGSTQ